ncbi:hypothetical protein BJX64DRAFT_289774 [Aspergillus heterothallicus]
MAFSSVPNTLRVWINGLRLPPIDQTNPEVDVTDFVLLTGSNSMVLGATNILFKDYLPSIRSAGTASGEPCLYMSSVYQRFGTLGPVGVEFLKGVETRGFFELRICLLDFID